MDLKCIMLECSNEDSKGIARIGKISNLTIDKRFYFEDLRSSPIIKIEFIEDLIKIKTKNTEYLFREIK